MKKSLWVAIVIILVVALGGWLFFHRNQSEAITNVPLSGDGPIIAFGDSLVDGYGSTKGHDFVADLSHDLNINIINAGENGDTTAEALARLDTVLSQNPKLVIVLLGGNDFLRKVPQETTFVNLTKIVSQIQEKKAAVLLLGIQGGFFSDPYKSSFQNLATNYKTAYVSNVLNGLIGHDQFMFDTVHPNDAGYEIIAKRMEPVLQDILNRK